MSTAFINNHLNTNCASKDQNYLTVYCNFDHEQNLAAERQSTSLSEMIDFVAEHMKQNDSSIYTYEIYKGDYTPVKKELWYGDGWGLQQYYREHGHQEKLEETAKMNTINLVRPYNGVKEIHPTEDPETFEVSFYPARMDLIDLINEELKIARALPEMYGARKVNGLSQLKEMLEKKFQHPDFDLNDEITLKDKGYSLAHADKIHTLLNTAAMFAPAPVVKYLLENGAKADNTTIHHAVRNRDMDNVIGELQQHGVDINSLNKKGETAWYKNKRKGNLGKDAVTCLEKHDATVKFFQQAKAAILNLKDGRNQSVAKFGLHVTIGGRTGC